MIDQQQLLDKLCQELKNISFSDLENLQIKYLGRHGLVNNLFQKIKEINNSQEKQTYGGKKEFNPAKRYR